MDNEFKLLYFPLAVALLHRSLDSGSGQKTQNPCSGDNRTAYGDDMNQATT
jgi:hypothetical protein